MSFVEQFAKLEHPMRRSARILPPSAGVRLFSAGRTWFAQQFAHDVPRESFVPPDPLGVTAWGLRFRLPIWNAAGMFKKGEAYDVVAAQGAGGYVAGTTTSRARAGNVRGGVRWPAVPYAHSGVASNWMGLPNEGHAVVAHRLRGLQRVAGCPVGASLSADPGVEGDVALAELMEGLRIYADAGVDYIELNESCPNVPGHHGAGVLDIGLIHRLDVVASRFLAHRSQPLPVVVKFSTDTSLQQLPELMQVLVERGFDGVILGNTSTRYAEHRSAIDERDKPLYDYFTTEYGGGLSGSVLRSESLAACVCAQQVVQQLAPSQEFQVIRCGGVATAEDIEASFAAGILLNQWYVGYFDEFSRSGHAVYRNVASRLRVSRCDTLS